MEASSARVDGPAATVGSLVDELRHLGVVPGAVVLVHTSLSALGPVVGGEHAVVLALQRAVTDRAAAGTVVMPTQSWQLCDPAYLNDPSVPRDWWAVIRDNLPAWDPALTPTRSMGRVAELFRTVPGARRSDHPHRSFAAVGPSAADLMGRHDLDSPVGSRSPLAALYDCRAQVVLLGVGHDKATALHLAEDRVDYAGKHRVRNGAPLHVGGRRVWVAFDELWPDSIDFAEVGAAFDRDTGMATHGTVGRAHAISVPLRQYVDFAAEWLPPHRARRGPTADTTAW